MEGICIELIACMHCVYFQITVTSGVGASLDLMAHALADPGGEYMPRSI